MIAKTGIKFWIIFSEINIKIFATADSVKADWYPTLCQSICYIYLLLQVLTLFMTDVLTSTDFTHAAAGGLMAMANYDQNQAMLWKSISFKVVNQFSGVVNLLR